MKVPSVIALMAAALSAASFRSETGEITLGSVPQQVARAHIELIAVRFSIPLPFWNKNQGDIAETTAMRARAEAEVVALRLKAGSEVSAARKEMERLLPFLNENANQLLPMAQQQIDRVREGYSDNKASLQDLLRARDHQAKHVYGQVMTSAIVEQPWLLD